MLTVELPTEHGLITFNRHRTALALLWFEGKCFNCQTFIDGEDKKYHLCKECKESGEYTCSIGRCDLPVHTTITEPPRHRGKFSCRHHMFSFGKGA